MSSQTSTNSGSQTSNGTVVLRVLGALMLAHLALLVMLKVSRGIEGEMLWISHAALAIGGLGLLMRSRDMIATAFVSICVIHALWIFDAAVGNTTGRFPLDATTYVALSDLPTLLTTSHHLYLAPVLAFAITRIGFNARVALPSAAALFALLSTASKTLLPPSMNVNLAHAVLPSSRSDLLLAYQTLSTPVYLMIHTGVATILFFVPGALLASWAGKRAGSHCQTHYSPAITAQTPEPLSAPSALSIHNKRSAFTLIELIAVLVVLGVLSGVALPKYIDYTERANKNADEGELAGIRTAFKTQYLQNRTNDAASTSWIASVNDIAGAMATNEMPSGIKINGARLQDRRGNLYDFVAETKTTPARLTLVPDGGGGGSS